VNKPRPAKMDRYYSRGSRLIEGEWSSSKPGRWSIDKRVAVDAGLSKMSIGGSEFDVIDQPNR